MGHRNGGGDRGPRTYRRQYLRILPPSSETPLWARRLVIGAALSGALWGLAFVSFTRHRRRGFKLLLVFVVGGMVARAAGTLALHLPAFFGFTAAAILPSARA